MTVDAGTAWGSWGLGGTYPVLLIAVSMACLSLGATLMYVIHSRRFRLNWFERSRLDSLACEEATVVKLCNRPRYHSGSTCSGGSLADLTAALPPTAMTSASRSSSLHKFPPGGSQDQVSGIGSSLGVAGGSGTIRGAICPDSQSLRSVGSSVSVATTGTAQSAIDAMQPLISAASSEMNVGSDLSPCSDASSVIHKYVQPSSGSGVGPALAAAGGAQRPKVNTMYEKIDHTKFNADMYRYRAERSTEADVSVYLNGDTFFTFDLIDYFDLISDPVRREFAVSAPSWWPFSSRRFLKEQQKWTFEICRHVSV